MPVAADAFLQACPSRVVLARLGEKWALLLVVLLAEGPMRFGELRRRVQGASAKMLSQTLRSLERDGLVNRNVHDGRPLRVEYRLTPLGADLARLSREMKAWAERHLPEIRAARARYDRRAATSVGAMPGGAAYTRSSPRKPRTA